MQKLRGRMKYGIVFGLCGAALCVDKFILRPNGEGIASAEAATADVERADLGAVLRLAQGHVQEGLAERLLAAAEAAPERSGGGVFTVPPAWSAAQTQLQAEQVAANAATDLPALKAVLTSPGGMLAIVDGRPVRVGDSLGGRRVSEILPGGVVLVGDAGTVTLRLPTRTGVAGCADCAAAGATCEAHSLR